MMEKMMARGEQIAHAARQQQINRLAARLRQLLGSSAVSTDEARVIVSGRGMIKRWLIDPSLRFLSGGRT